jgi:serine/threonine-protein kinase
MSVDPASPFHEALDRFEEAWQGVVPPALGQFIPSDLAPEGRDGADMRRRLLIELVKIDLNHRWRRDARTNVRKTRPIPRLCVTMLKLRRPTVDPAPAVSPPTAALPACPSLDDYAACFPELGPVERLPADLIAEEYWARTRAGEVVDRQAYLARYGPRVAELEPVLAELEPELAVGPVHGHTLLADAAASNRSVSSPLLDALRATRLLTPKQLSELVDLDLQGQLPDGAALDRELRVRGWLTAYQIDQLRAGDLQALTLGPYQLLEPLGEGIVGRVFKARHKDMGRLVALKIIRQEVLATPQVLARFYREIRAAGRVFHPHIVETYDAGPSGNAHSLAMEYVEGIDLDRLVRASGPLPVPQATAYIAQTAEALQCLLEHGVVHRDVTPSNLMVTCAGTAPTAPWGIIKLVGLGLALLRPISGDDAITSLTALGTPVGTPDFMAPEQALDAHAADIRADLYSLGCTWYYLLTGQVPFPGGTAARKLVCHQVQEPRPVRRLRPEVPLRLATILRKLMAKRPEDRYQKPVDLLAELRSAVGELSRPARKSGDDIPSQSPTVLPPSARAQTVPVQPPGVGRTFPRWLLGGMVISVLILLLVAWAVFS